MHISMRRLVAGQNAPAPPGLAMALLAVFQLAALSGCAGFSHDGGFDRVAGATHAHLAQEVYWPRTDQERAKSAAQVTALLAHPLSVDDAIQIALLNNRDLRASFEQLGISEADLVQSGRLPNPRFDLTHASAAGQFDIEQSLTFNVLSLLTMPYAHDIQKRRFEQTQQQVELRILQVAEDTREAYLAAVAASQSLQYQNQVRLAADASAKLAQRMLAAGNWNPLDEAREHGFATDALLGLTRAQFTQAASQEKLLRLLALANSAAGAQPALQLAERLPELPPSIEALPDVEQVVLRNRLDLRLQRLELEALAHSLKLTKATRFIAVLEVGPTRVKQGPRQDPYENGYQFSLEVPIFDSGEARVRKAEAIYAQAVDRFEQAAINARSQIRQAYAKYQGSYQLAKQQRDEVLPLRQAVADQNLLLYNASLIGIFELLADAREQLRSVEGYIQSTRDFWIAKSELDAALLGGTAPAAL
jgi:outer membrane protein TolC